MSSAAEPWEYPEHKQFERWDSDLDRFDNMTDLVKC